jgi:hypothetical protein
LRALLYNITKTNKRIYQNSYDLLKLFDNDFDKASVKKIIASIDNKHIIKKNIQTKTLESFSESELKDDKKP